MKQKVKYLWGMLLLMLLLLPISCNAEVLSSLTMECNGMTLGDGSVVTSENGSFYFNFYTEAETDQVYRITLYGTAEDGTPVETYGGFSGDYGSMYMSIYTPGTYGPFSLKIQCGSEVMEYGITFVIPEEVTDSEYYPEYMTEMPFYNYWDPNKRFIGITTDAEAPIEESAEPIVLEMPADGSILSGADGYVMEVYYYLNEDMNGVALELRDPETGEVLDGFNGSEERTVGSYGTYLSVEHFESGKEYELVVTSGEYEVVNRITLIEEVEPETVTVVEAPKSLDVIMDAEAEAVFKGKWYDLGRPANMKIYLPKNWTEVEVPEENKAEGTYNIIVDPNADTGIVTGLITFTEISGGYFETKESALDSLRWAIEDGMEGIDNAETLNGSANGIPYTGFKMEVSGADGTTMVQLQVYYGVDVEAGGSLNGVNILVYDKKYVEYLDSIINSVQLYKTYSDAETVMMVQNALNEAGYDCGTADGIAGENTRTQISEYQKENGLEPTGNIDDDLLESFGIDR